MAWTNTEGEDGNVVSYVPARSEDQHVSNNDEKAKPKKSKSKSEQKDAEQKATGTLTAREIIGAIGFGMYIGWVFLCCKSIVFLPQGDTLWADPRILLPLAAYVTSAVLTCAITHFADTWARLRIRQDIPVALALSAFLPLATLFLRSDDTFSLAILTLAWICCGASMALGGTRWSRYFWGLQKKTLTNAIIVSFFTATTCYFFVALISQPAQIIMAWLLTPLSVACLFVHEKESEAPEFISKADSQKALQVDMKTTISLAVSSLAAGYLLCRVIALQSDMSFVIIGSAILLCAALSLVVKVMRGDYALLLGPVFRLSYPVMVVGFLLLPFITGPFEYICEAVVFATVLSNWLSLMVNTSFAGHWYHAQALYFWVRGHIPWCAGLAGGWALGYLSVTLEMNAAIPGTLFTLGFVALFAISTAITPYGADHLTFPEEFDAQERYRTEEGKNDRFNRAWWKKACDKVADDCRLTPRETEIFHYLAKGRNSKVIEREFTISAHTVKTHTYNIYRKMGVDSQQALIDHVEEVSQDLKEEQFKPYGRSPMR